jgi:hypothetical protein
MQLHVALNVDGKWKSQCYLYQAIVGIYYDATQEVSFHWAVGASKKEVTSLKGIPYHIQKCRRVALDRENKQARQSVSWLKRENELNTYRL